MPKTRVMDVLWLLALGVYVIAGMPITPFHGDETNYVWASRDFSAVFLRGQPQSLIFDDPFTDGAGYLRIIHGSMTNFSIGFALNAAGLLDESNLPPRGYNWGEAYSWNVENGTRPDGILLIMSRAPLAFYLALSAAIMFGLGWLFGGRPVAYLVSALYALNPAILLNGRRATQEGALLCFGLLTILVAAWIARKRDNGESVGWRWWLIFALAAALAVASKNTGVIFVASAFGWLLIADLVNRRWRGLKGIVPRLLISGVLAVAIFWAISPGMWHDDPIERINQLLAVREQQIGGQVRGINKGAAPMTQRVAYIFFEPYMLSPQYFELSYWGRIPDIAESVQRYEASILSGLHAGVIGGGALTLLALVGLAVSFIRRRRPPLTWGFYAGLIVWLAVNVVVLLLNPLPWQRYYLPLIPVVVLLTGIGIYGLARAVFLARHRHATVAY